MQKNLIMFTTADEVLEFINSFFFFTDNYGIFTDAQLLNSLCNYVWKVSTGNYPGRATATLIVKQYDGVVRSAPSVALSTQRAFVEWSGLSAAYVLSKNISNCRWSVPRPLLYDGPKNVIVMEFVQGPSLFEYLSKEPPEEQSPEEQSSGKISEISPVSPPPPRQQHPPGQEHLGWITDAVVAFAHDVAQLELDPSILHASRENPVFEYMENEKTLADALFTQLPDGQGPVWSAIVQAEASNERIIYGDLWPAGIILDTTTQTIAILDWECTRKGNDFEDLTQLLANLFLMSEGAPFHRDVASDLMHRIAPRIPKQAGKRVQADFLYTLLTLKDYPHWGLVDAKEAVVARACREDSAVMRVLGER